MTITPLMFREYLVFSYNIAVIYIYIYVLIFNTGPLQLLFSKDYVCP